MSYYNEVARVCDNLSRFLFCAPCVALGLRPTLPDDPWFRDPEDATELIYHVQRMDATYDPGEGEPPALAIDFIEKTVLQRAGQITIYFPGAHPGFWCATWNVVRSVSGTSNGQLRIKILPAFIAEVSQIMEELTDFKGKPIPVLSESVPMPEDMLDDRSDVDAVADQRALRPDVPIAAAIVPINYYTRFSAPTTVAVEERA